MFPTLLTSTSYIDNFKDENGNKFYVYEDIWTEFAKTALSQIFLYATIALAVILLTVGLFVKFKKPELLKNYFKTAIALAVGFAVTVIITMLSLKFYDMRESGAVFRILLIPTAISGGVIVTSIAACYVCSLFSKKTFKVSLIVCGSLCLASLIALFVCLGVYYASGDAAASNGISRQSVKDLPLYLCSLGIIAAIVTIAVCMGRGEEKAFGTKHIAYAAICLSLSFALSYIKLFAMPQGGSITLASLLPLMIYSYMFGIRKGVFVGMIYGILQAIQDPWLLHPAQFLLDYPIAFAAIGVTGMFKKAKAFAKTPQLSFTLGAVVAGCLRFLSHIFSGVFAFSEYAGDMNVWAYSAAYNSFVFIDIAIVIVLGAVLLSSKSFLREINRHAANTSAPKQDADKKQDTDKSEP